MSQTISHRHTHITVVYIYFSNPQWEQFENHQKYFFPYTRPSLRLRQERTEHKRDDRGASGARSQEGAELARGGQTFAISVFLSVFTVQPFLNISQQLRRIDC